MSTIDVAPLDRDAHIYAGRDRRYKVPFIVGVAMTIVGLVTLAAVVGDGLAPVPPAQQDLVHPLFGPSVGHLFGTDDLGRDVFSRTVAGARSAVVGPLLIAIGAALIGNVLGLLAGYLGGWTDSVIMRWVDFMYALPPLLVALVVVGVLGGGYFLAVALLVVVTAPYDTRIVRAVASEQRPLAYVEAARTLGISRTRIMFAHILPNVLPVSLANAFLNFAFSLVALAGLAYLGLGAGPGTADWGRMLSDSRTILFANPWTVLGPGLAIVLLAVSMNLIGDWIYERFAERGRAR
jgi:peptide/nickel transport system permease protein